MSTVDHWVTALCERFHRRHEGASNEMEFTCWDDYPPQAISAVFDILEEEYGVPRALYRPEDPMDLFFQPVSTRNPLKWLTFQGLANESRAALNYRLKRHIPEYTRKYPPGSIGTIGELVDAWASVNERE